MVLVGVNLKQELPLLNSRLRSSFLRDNSKVACIGSSSDGGFPIASLGLGLEDLESFVEGRHAFCSLFAKAGSPKLVLSSELFDKTGGLCVSSLLDTLSKKT